MIQKNFVVFTASAILFLIVFSIPSLIASQENSNKPSKTEVIQKTKKLQMPFIVNNGQMDEKVKFYANTFGGTVFVTKEGEIVYSLPNNSSELGVESLKPEDRSQGSEARIQKCRGELHSPGEISPLKRGDKGVCKTAPIFNDRNETHPRPPLLERRTGIALREEFVGAKIKTIQGEKKSITNVNYFKGKDPSKWKTNISTYDIVSLGEVYDGIELKLKAYGSNVEKLFCVKPSADPDQIKIKLSGVKNPKSESRIPKLLVNEHGELEVETELGSVKFTKPVAYQEIEGKRVDVSVEYRVESSEAENKSSKHKICNSKLMSTNPKSTIRNPQFIDSNPKSKIANRKLEYGFTVASYDKTKDLVIDPLLASTYLGGSANDFGKAISVDQNGNVYVTGTTFSTDFPTTTGAYDTSYNDSTDVFISKLDSGLTSLLVSTLLGGSNGAGVNSIIIDSDGNVYVAGYGSSDFPTTSNAYDSESHGGAFVSKLNGDLSKLLASTYLGGSSGAVAYSMTMGSSGNVYVTGMTGSTDFPTTTGAYDTSYNGNSDIFVSKLNGDLTNLLASTYLGGSSNDMGYSIGTDSTENVYLAGYTASLDFPITTDAYDTSKGRKYADAFVSKLSKDLTSLLASTYLGGNSHDSASSIILNSKGNVYIAGYTKSSDFPTTYDAYDTSSNRVGPNTSGDAFISELNGELTSLLVSTFIGGSNDDIINSIFIDSDGIVYASGKTSSKDFPTTYNSYDTSYNGYYDYDYSYYTYDAFILKISKNLSRLIASTFLGGLEDDTINSMTVDSEGNICVTGYTNSTDFPVTANSYNTSNSGTYDIFVSEFDSNLSASTDEVKKGKVYGYVLDEFDEPIKSVKIKIRGEKTKYFDYIKSNENGYFMFKNLSADTYYIIAEKRDYKKSKQKVILGKGEEEEIEIVMK